MKACKREYSNWCYMVRISAHLTLAMLHISVHLLLPIKAMPCQDVSAH
jgi:hypothetical protein